MVYVRNWAVAAGQLCHPIAAGRFAGGSTFGQTANVATWWKADVALRQNRGHCPHMTDYIWSHIERRDLYLATRILANSGRYDGDWTQWASDTLIYDLEIYNDPRQGVGSFLRDDEVQLVDELGERLWSIVQTDPFSAAALLAEANPSLQPLASNLAERIEANGRRIV